MFRRGEFAGVGTGLVEGVVGSRGIESEAGELVGGVAEAIACVRLCDMVWFRAFEQLCV